MMEKEQDVEMRSDASSGEYTNNQRSALPVIPSLWQGLRANTRLSLWGIFISSVALTMGYEIVFVGGIVTVPAFTRVFGDLKPVNTSLNPARAPAVKAEYRDPYMISGMWIALWAVSHPIGAAVGAILGGLSQDRIGRRYTMAVATIWQAIAITICFVADKASNSGSRSAVYFAGKVVQGIGIGALLSSAHTYMSEVLPPSTKGPIMSLTAPFILLGSVLGFVTTSIASKDHPSDPSLAPDPAIYRKAIAGQWITTIIPLLLVIFLPESPVYNIRKQKLAKAERGCKRLQGKPKDHSDDLLSTLVELVAKENHAKATGRIVSYADLFKTKSDLHRTLNIMLVMTVPHLLGLTVLSHANVVAVSLGMNPGKAGTLLIIGSVIGLVAAFGGFVVLDKFGRRTILLSSIAIITVLWLATGISGCFQGDLKQLSASGEQVTPALQNFVIAMFICIVFFLSLGAYPVSYAIAGETSSLELRAKSSGAAWASNMIATCVVSAFAPFLYALDSAALGGKLGFVFFAIGFVYLLICWLFVPETKGLDIIGIGRVYQGPAIVARWFGRRRKPTAEHI